MHGYSQSHSDQGCSMQKVVDYLLYRVLQGDEWHPTESHRAPLGVEGHATEP